MHIDTSSYFVPWLNALIYREVVELVIQASKSGQQLLDDTTRRLPIDYALELDPSHAPITVFDLLLEKSPESLLHRKGEDGNTPLHTALELHSHVKIIEMMLKSCPECCRLENIGMLCYYLCFYRYNHYHFCGHKYHLDWYHLDHRQENTSTLRFMATEALSNSCTIEYTLFLPRRS